jgi:hypothetical protein
MTAKQKTPKKDTRKWAHKTQLFYYEDGRKERPRVKRAAAKVKESVSTFSYNAVMDRTEKVLGEL